MRTNRGRSPGRIQHRSIWFRTRLILGCFLLPCILLIFLKPNAEPRSISFATPSTRSKQQSKINIKSLDVDGLKSKTYTSFLNDIRKKLAASYSRKVPVLRVENKTIDPPPLFDIVLKTKKTQITMKFRADNLYLIGYQMQHPKKWLELGESGKHIISGAEFLGFNESYGAMERAAKQTVQQISLTKESFKKVLNDLANSMDMKTRAKGMILLAQMISEASRFVNISDHIASYLDNGTDYLPTWMRNLENKWEKFSTIVLKADAYPCYKYTPQTINGKELKTVDQLRSIFGIMFRDPDTLKKPC